MGSNPTSGAGGDGGGVLYLECGEIHLSGTLDARGANGQGAVCSNCTSHDDAGGGGGGGGGVVLIRTREVLTASGQVLVDGGNGGLGAGETPQTGGAGADGYWDLVVVD